MSRALYQKLGIKSGDVILVLNLPKAYLEFFNEFPSDVSIKTRAEKTEFKFVHIFVKTVDDLDIYFNLAKDNLCKDGVLWVSWIKQSAEEFCELNQFTVMNYGLTSGLVDTKIVSIDENWSGHKFVYRLMDR